MMVSSNTQVIQNILLHQTKEIKPLIIFSERRETAIHFHREMESVIQFYRMKGSNSYI